MKMPSLKEKMLEGEKVVLRPMTEEEIPMFFSWATQSDVSHLWYGEMYGNQPPTFEKFISDWKDYFDDKASHKGRCWTILVDDVSIGMISWDEIDFEERRTGIDIIIGSSANCGRGYGSDALRILSTFLFENAGLSTIYIGAHIKNLRAIKAYEKAGFRRVEITQEMRTDKYIVGYMQGLNENSVLLIKERGM